MRGVIEHLLQSSQHDEEVKSRAWKRAVEINAWTFAEGFNEHRSVHEARWMEAAPGEWPQSVLVDASERVEALGCLMWAQGFVVNLPPYDTHFRVDELFDNLPVGEYVEDFLRQTSLRPFNQIEHARDAAELWHWRARAERLLRAGHGLPGKESPEELIATISDGAYRHKAIVEPVDNDFPIAGHAYRMLSDHTFGVAALIAYQRHYAFNWLCGYAEANSHDWDQVPTDT